MMPFTTTPPTGMPNSRNQLMNRVMTAMGRLSGKVTKKNAVSRLIREERLGPGLLSLKLRR
jgi:hypothetical protein